MIPYITWLLNNNKQTITTCWTTPHHHEIINTCTTAPYPFSHWFCVSILKSLLNGWSPMLEGWRVGGLEGWRVGGSEVLSSRWFDIQTSKCYREFELFNRKLVLMYDGRVEARTREREYWKGLIYWKWKGEHWDEDMKMSLEFKRTKVEWWRQMKTGMWLGFSEGSEFSESDSNASEGSEDGWNRVRGVVGDWSWIRWDLGNRMGISTT